jgi:uncharacterized membrane protein YdjX (TVP38/TMEM64 family)
MLKVLVRAAPLLMVAICVVFFVKNFWGIPPAELIDRIVNYVPPQPIVAALVIILLFMLKSLSIFFPMVVLIGASGLMFPLPVALIVNAVGVFTMLVMPFLIGRFAEADLVDGILKKYPKLEKAREVQIANQTFLSYFLRVLNLPAEVVSMYLGSIKVSAKKYFLGSFLGILPGMVFSTIAGAAIDDPMSLQFILAIVIEVIFSAGSAIFYAIYKKHQKKNPT